MKSNIFGDKRGSLLDPIFSSAYILKIVLTIFIALIIWIAFQNVMTGVIAGKHSQAILTTVMGTLSTAYFSIDNVFPLLVGGLILVSTIFAYKTGTNIVWGMASFIFWGLAVLLSTVFVNIYLMFSDQFPTIYTALPIIDATMSNLHWVTFFWIVIITAVMFRKNNVEDDASETQRRFYGK